MPTFDEYQEKAFSTAIYPGAGEGNIVYPTLGLNGEAGEIAEKVKKVIRDSGGEVSPELRETLKKEIGDVLWYVAVLSRELGLGLEEVADANLVKLASRRDRDRISGSGDER